MSTIYVPILERYNDSIVKLMFSIIVYSPKSVGIITECIIDRNDSNKRNNFLNLICVLCLKWCLKVH